MARKKTKKGKYTVIITEKPDATKKIAQSLAGKKAKRMEKREAFWYEFKKDFEKELGHSLLNWDWMELKPKAPLPWTDSHMKAALLAAARFQK